MNCKDFKTRVEEGLKGDSLPIAAQDHAASCRPCREFNQKHVEFREWLTVCEKITAPKDFQFGVQRRIASSGAVHSHDWLWQGLRYIVPSAAAVAVLVLAIGYFSTSNNSLPDGKGVAVMSNSEIGNPAAVKDNAANEYVAGSLAPQVAQPADTVEEPAKPENEKLALENANKQSNNPNKQSNQARTIVPKEEAVPPGGSITHFDSAVKPEAPSTLPKGIHMPADQSSTQTALLRLGVITSAENGAIKVTFVKPDAKSAGVQIGDVIENLSGNVLTLKRGGQTLTINLK